MRKLSGRRILLCVGGGVAAYKVAELTRLLVKSGAEVRCALTPAAQRFVGPLTFEALSGRAALTDLFAAGAEHIHLADWAELALVAPATADLLGRLAAGLADDAVTATLIAIDPKSWLLAPSMNERMWSSPAVTANMATLRARGAQVVGPAAGEMAERAHRGPGRLSEPTEIFEAVCARLAPGDLVGVRVLVTAGPTREELDPVRFLSNPSTGRMGFAIAEAAHARGAEVTLIAGPTELEPPRGVRVVRVVSAEEMARAVDANLGGVQAVIMSAAVADQRPAVRAQQKSKKQDGEELLTLVRTPDILAGLAARFASLAERPVLVGFAAETEKVEEHAREKLVRKQLDLIVANDVSVPGVGFASRENRVLLLDREGGRAEIAGSKLHLSHLLWDRVLARLRAAGRDP